MHDTMRSECRRPRSMAARPVPSRDSINRSALDAATAQVLTAVAREIGSIGMSPR